MLTWNERRFVGREAGTYRYEGSCLSTDTKPTSGVANGSVLIEMDTGKVYLFDEAGTQWREFAEEDES